jgi:hypothetical protein
MPAAAPAARSGVTSAFATEGEDVTALLTPVSGPGPAAASAGTAPARSARPRRGRRTVVLAGVGLAVSGSLVAAAVFSGVLDRLIPGGGETVTGGGAAPSGVPAAGPSGDDSASDSARLPSALPDAGVPVSGDALVTRFRNERSGLCLDTEGGQAVAGAAVVTTTCAESGTQLWRFEATGLLRSAADTQLCLSSAQDFGLELVLCTVAQDSKNTGGSGEDDLHFDLSADGLLSPRRAPELVVVPVRRAVEAVIVLKSVDLDNNGNRTQRWRTGTDTSAGGTGEDESPSQNPSPTAYPTVLTPVSPTARALLQANSAGYQPDPGPSGS